MADMKDILNGLHSARAIAIDKAAVNILTAHAWNERAAVAMVRDSIGHGLSTADANEIIDHITYLVTDELDDEELGAVIDEAGNPTPTTLSAFKVHTIGGKPPPPEGWRYGQTHDMDCPGCINTPFTASPRSETYWSS